MIKKFIEKQFDDILGQNISDFDKFLRLFSFFLYITTFLSITSKFKEQINSFFKIIYSNQELSLQEELSTLIIFSLLFVAMYYLLRELASILRYIVSSIINDVLYIYARIFKDYRESKVWKKYKYDNDIVLKIEVKKYLENNQDETIQKKLEAQNNYEISLLKQKRDLMLISILLTVNLFLYQNSFDQFVNLYRFTMIIITVYAGIIPYDNFTFMYIRNNQIRQ